MKRILLTTIAALMIAAPMATAPAMAAPQNHQQDDRNNRGNDRHDNDRHDNDRHDNDWDQSRHNGYYVGKAWHAGPPPATIIRRSDYRPAYKVWARGDRLGYYGNRYTVVDYRSHHLKHPPRGYHWVQDDRGDFILAAVAGGLIASVILGGH
ncbi:MAG: RcnB family protein [Alphaproteobacteria bacterium]